MSGVICLQRLILALPPNDVRILNLTEDFDWFFLSGFGGTHGVRYRLAEFRTMRNVPLFLSHFGEKSSFVL